MSILDISHHALLILVLHLELQFISIYHSLANKRKHFKLLQTSITYRLEELMVSTLRLMITFMTSQIKED